jgi:hypothetical protein
MTAPDDEREKITWDTIEEVAADAELRRWATMSDAEVDDALARRGVDPRRLEEKARRAAGARVPRLDDARARRARWTKWAAVVAVAAVVVLVLAWKRRDIEALWSPAPIERDHWTTPPTQSPEERAAADRAEAAKLREQAFAQCDAKHWDECEARLDDAKKLDPAGEGDPRVEMQRMILDEEKKGPIGPKPQPSVQ